MRQVMVRGLQKVDQMFVLTMAAYNLTRMRSLAQLRPEATQLGKNDENTLFKRQIRHQYTQWSTDSLHMKQQSSAREAYQRPLIYFSLIMRLLEKE